MAMLWQYWQSEWALFNKVAFDGENLLIIVSEGVTDLDIKIDVYSAWKEWQSLYENAKWIDAIRTTGGDPTVGGQFSGDIYFLINGWRAVIDLTKVRVTGVLFSDDYETPWLDSATNLPVYPAQVSSLVTQAAAGAGVVPTAEENAAAVAEVVPTAEETASAVWAASTVPTSTENATAVWSAPVESSVDPGTVGEYLLWSQDAVILDALHGAAGTTGTVGTSNNPSSNLADAFVIAGRVKRRAFRVRGSLALDRNVTDWRFTGEAGATLDLGGWASVRTYYQSVTLTGDAGNSVLFGEQVTLAGLTRASGTFFESGISGTLGVGSASGLVLDQCHSLGLPVLDFEDATDDCSILGFTGAVALTNLVSAGLEVVIDLSSGYVRLEATCTAGSVVVRGVGILEDLSGPGCAVNRDGLVLGRTLGDILDLSTLSL